MTETRGRKKKYDWENLDIGDSFIIGEEQRKLVLRQVFNRNRWVPREDWIGVSISKTKGGYKVARSY